MTQAKLHTLSPGMLEFRTECAREVTDHRQRYTHGSLGIQDAISWYLWLVNTTADAELPHGKQKEYMQAMITKFIATHVPLKNYVPIDSRIGMYRSKMALLQERFSRVVDAPEDETTYYGCVSKGYKWNSSTVVHINPACTRSNARIFPRTYELREIPKEVLEHVNWELCKECKQNPKTYEFTVRMPYSELQTLLTAKELPQDIVARICMGARAATEVTR